MSTKITLTYCGMEGCGRTAKEAKQEAARRIEAALAGDYTPRCLPTANTSPSSRESPAASGATAYTA